MSNPLACALAVACAALLSGCVPAEPPKPQPLTPSQQMGADLQKTGEQAVKGGDTTNFDLLQ